MHRFFAEREKFCDTAPYEHERTADELQHAYHAVYHGVADLEHQRPKGEQV